MLFSLLQTRDDKIIDRDIKKNSNIGIIANDKKSSIIDNGINDNNEKTINIDKIHFLIALTFSSCV